jgi:hypothetical protein
MAAISISTTRGAAGVKAADYVVSTLAPNAGEFEFRMQVLDGAGNPVKRINAINALEMIRRQIESGTLGAFTTNILAT